MEQEDPYVFLSLSYSWPRGSYVGLCVPVMFSCVPIRVLYVPKVFLYVSLIVIRCSMLVVCVPMVSNVFLRLSGRSYACRMYSF